MQAAPTLSIVIALKDGAANILPLLDVLRTHEDVEVIICTAGPVPHLGDDAKVILVPMPPDTLIPLLWSAGIRRARAKAVALTTGEFIPSDNWVSQLLKADLDRFVGIGGAIDNDPRASPRNWAIFFLRYSAFALPLRGGETYEIAADNAVYNREAILEHPDLLDEGFWEPSFHRRFSSAGRKLTLDPDLVVVHHATVSFRSFARQRHLHGRAYGSERASRASTLRNLLLIAASPLVSPLILARSIARSGKRPRYRAKLFPAFPWLVCFTLAWAAGEARGYLSGLVTRRTGTARTPPKGH